MDDELRKELIDVGILLELSLIASLVSMVKSCTDEEIKLVFEITLQRLNKQKTDPEQIEKVLAACREGVEGFKTIINEI
jgi:hypothetical protein